MAKLLSEPTFIPKFLDGAILSSGVGFSHFLIDAHYLFFRSELFQQTREQFPSVIIDPVTHGLQFQNTYEKPTFQQLPYSSVTDIQRVISDPTYRLNSLVVPVIDFQVTNQAAFIIAPYLCTDDVNSTIFSNNLTMLGETLYILNGRDSQPPLLAPICIGGNVLRDRRLTDYIIDCYKAEPFHSAVQGYFIIMVTDFDDRLADEDQLLGLADITYQLSQDKDVIINHLGGFGEVLNAIGASAFVSSPGGGETFSLKQLQQDSKNIRGRNHSLWRYVPELFDYISEDLLGPEEINYRCDCAGCANAGTFPSVYAARKIHFLIKRMAAIQLTTGMSRDEKIQNLIQRLSAAESLARGYVVNLGADIKVAHLTKWRRILEISRGWNYQQDDDELERLLQELG